MRAGIALYGLAPSKALAGGCPCAPPYPSRPHRAGQGGAEGWRRVLRLALEAARDTVLATLSIGYADGVRRGLGSGGRPGLVGGRRRPMIGVVTMDQLLVDCGPDADVAVGDEAVLLGAAGPEAVTADEWADLLGTISYEIVTGLGRARPSVRDPPLSRPRGLRPFWALAVPKE